MRTIDVDPGEQLPSTYDRFVVTRRWFVHEAATRAEFLRDDIGPGPGSEACPQHSVRGRGEVALVGLQV